MRKRISLNRERLLKDETGTILKRKEASYRLKIALAYPNSYYVGMSNLGFQLLYRLFNQFEEVVCERVFLPEDRAGKKRGRKITSFENNLPLKDFDILAFTINYELDYFNVLRIIDGAGIPLKAHARRQGPIVIAGGACVTMNPEPLADFIDLFFLGEGEPAIEAIIRKYSAPGISRSQKLDRLAKLPGAYRPHTPPLARKLPERLVCREPSGVFSQIITPHTEFSRIFLLEISRGCKNKCAFCLVGEIYAPYRPYRFESLKPFIDRALSSGRKIGLVAANPADHPEIEKIMQYILAEGGIFTTSSIKIGPKGIRLLPYLRKTGCRTVTLAPESASQRLLNLLKKGLSIPQILEMTKAVYVNSIPNLKLYFLLGIPGEKEEDFQALVSLIREIDRIRQEKSPQGKIILSFNPLVPKPHTGFAHVPPPDFKKYSHWISLIRKEFKAHKQIKIIAEKASRFFCQNLLSSGSRELSSFLEAVALKGISPGEAVRTYSISQIKQ